MPKFFVILWKICNQSTRRSCWLICWHESNVNQHDWLRSIPEKLSIKFVKNHWKKFRCCLAFILQKKNTKIAELPNKKATDNCRTIFQTLFEGAHKDALNIFFMIYFFLCSLRESLMMVYRWALKLLSGFQIWERPCVWSVRVSSRSPGDAITAVPAERLEISSRLGFFYFFFLNEQIGLMCIWCGNRWCVRHVRPINTTWNT